jgi:hypothetical protein
MTRLFSVMLTCLCFQANAQTLDPAPPAVDQNLVIPPGNLVNEEDEHREACTNMSKEIRALEGKPMRRSALQQRYDAECKH